MKKKLLSKYLSKLAHGLIGAWFEKQQKISYACVPLTAPLLESIWLVNIGVEVITCILYVHHGINKLWNQSDGSPENVSWIHEFKNISTFNFL